MIQSKFKWQMQKTPDQQLIKKFAEGLKVDPLIATILLQRGFNDISAAETFLKPSAKSFHDPLLMHDMAKGISRIQQAIESAEQITIYGDYDADGITSTTIMFEVLTDLGANVDYYIPNRFTDGYGPNSAAFKKIINGGTTLIVTVDNGVAGSEAIDVANDLHCDVIVTDHHSLPDKLPNAYAIIHPRVKNKEGLAYPFGELSGAGVALKVAQALTDELPVDLIDIASIGTVADVVSLTDENRAIVKFGLTAIQNPQRPGLLALIKLANINLASFDEQDIGFGIAPRLNSLGRMDDANVGVELLSTFDEDRASQLADFANQQNDTRKSLVDQFYQEAVQMVEASGDADHRATLVVVGKDWHQGVLGIVASKILEKYGRPTLVLTTIKDTDELKGSGRSIDSFDLFAAIDPMRDQTVGFGGHHSAVGLTIKAEKLQVLRDQLEKAANDQQLDLSQKPTCQVMTALPAAKVTTDLVDQLAVLAPFGQDNDKPTFEILYDRLTNVKTMGQTGSHLRFSLVQGNQSLNAVAFRKGHLAAQLLQDSDNVRVVGQLSNNTWNGRTNVQLMVTDLSQSPAPIVDKRTKQLRQQMFTEPGVYVFFHEKLYNQLKSYVANDATAVLYDQVGTVDDPKRLFIVDCPDVVSDLKGVLQKCHPDFTILYLFKKRPVSKWGMPDRHSYAKLFRFVKQYPNFNIATHLQQLADHLDIASKTIVFMIQVFLELDFITVQDEVVNLNPNYRSKNLSSAPSYQLREEQLEAEKSLLASNTNELVSFVQHCLAD